MDSKFLIKNYRCYLKKINRAIKPLWCLSQKWKAEKQVFLSAKPKTQISPSGFYQQAANIKRLSVCPECSTLKKY